MTTGIIRATINVSARPAARIGVVQQRVNVRPAFTGLWGQILSSIQAPIIVISKFTQREQVIDVGVARVFPVITLVPFNTTMVRQINTYAVNREIAPDTTIVRQVNAYAVSGLSRDTVVRQVNTYVVVRPTYVPDTSLYRAMFFSIN